MAIGDLPPCQLKPRVYYDCNPPSKAHWTFRLFKEKRHPDTKEALKEPENYASMQLNPLDNKDNLANGYLDTLKAMSARARKRFLDGEFADATPNQLFPEEHIDPAGVLQMEICQQAWCAWWSLLIRQALMTRKTRTTTQSESWLLALAWMGMHISART